jgi:hypothetical protein
MFDLLSQSLLEREMIEQPKGKIGEAPGDHRGTHNHHNSTRAQLQYSACPTH